MLPVCSEILLTAQLLCPLLLDGEACVCFWHCHWERQGTHSPELPGVSAKLLSNAARCWQPRELWLSLGTKSP